jgi:hypothetical protein
MHPFKSAAVRAAPLHRIGQSLLPGIFQVSIRVTLATGTVLLNVHAGQDINHNDRLLLL